MILKLILSSSILAVAVSAGGPLYLYDAASREAHLETEYIALDQCTLWGTEQLRHNSFALRFQLTGKCENGFLICYPGALDPSGANWAYGMRPEIQFQVPNHPESKLGDQCLAYQKKCDKKNKTNHCNANRVWHGIRLSVPKSFGSLLLELSILKEPYNLSNSRFFSIELGNPNNLMTKIIDENGREIQFLDNDKTREAYLERKIKKDVWLRNYVGLWMLGLDFLPMHNRQTLQLHVYRDCGCEMHAWFVHPSDEVPSPRPEHPDVSADCPTKIDVSQTQHFALPKPANVDRAIRLRQRLNKDPKGVVLRFGNEQQKHLLELHIDQPPYGIINITSAQNVVETGALTGHFVDTDHSKSLDTVHRARKFKSMDDNVQSEDALKGAQAKGVDTYMDVEVVIRKYFYQVKVGDRKVVNYFPRSSEWWANDRMENITRIEIAGDVYPNSVEEPTVKEKPEQIVQAKVQTYTRRLEDPLEAGDSIVIRGRIGTPEKPKDGLSLAFYLLQNTPAFNVYVSKVVWCLRQMNGNLTMGYYNSEEQFHELAVANLDLFEPNEPFEMRIEIMKPINETRSRELGRLLVTVSTPSRTNQTIFRLLSLTSREIVYISVSGNLELFADPHIIVSPNFLLRKKTTFPVFPLLVAGDSLFLEGKLHENATQFQILFLHDSPVSNPYIGNVVFQITFSLDENGIMWLNTWSNKLMFAMSTDQSLGRSFPTKVFRGEQFKIEVRVAFDEYQVFVYGALAATYEHVLPPWAVNYLNIRGNFTSISKFALDRSNGTFRAPHLRSLDLPFVMEIPDQRMLYSGDSISVHGTVTKQNASITILILNEALETYESVAPSVREYKQNLSLSTVGIIVARAVFYTDSDGIGSFDLSYANKARGTESHKFVPALTLSQKFRLKIIMRERFEFHLDGYDPFVYELGGMPSWAIQYIRLEGDLKLSELPKVEFESKKRKDA
uniref:Galectin domain-containing protein n=1 Tax=Globodera rostochiensis TaxID=31243 RepID=A0A914HX48_GLORO